MPCLLGHVDLKVFMNIPGESPAGTWSPFSWKYANSAHLFTACRFLEEIIGLLRRCLDCRLSGCIFKAALKEFIHRRIYWFFLSAGRYPGSFPLWGLSFLGLSSLILQHTAWVSNHAHAPEPGSTCPSPKHHGSQQDHALGIALSNRDKMGGCLVTSSGLQRDFQMPYLGPDSPPHLPADPEGPQCEEISNTQLGRSFVWQASFTFPGCK